MFLTIEPHQYNPQFVMFSEKTKNNVLSGGDFYRIYYSDEECILNGVHIRLALRNITIEKYFNKIKCCFSRKENVDLVETIKTIEKNILSLTPNLARKRPVYRIEEQLNNDYIKLFTDIVPSFGPAEETILMLKISGIWANVNECGLTFRFFFTRPSGSA